MGKTDAFDVAGHGGDAGIRAAGGGRPDGRFGHRRRDGGDFVLTGGELPALVFVDTVGRLCEGVLADESCFTEESHFNGLLEYPQYSRPAVWHGKEVPAVLLSGHHANICRWRREQSLLRTRDKRPDLLEKAVLDAGDLAFLDGEKRIK